jgi:ABC-2 type transport system ATP-binding protein
MIAAPPLRDTDRAPFVRRDAAAVAVEMRDVSKTFGAVRALDGVSLRVEQGSMHALLGPNGAGKTTALGVLLGLRRPDAGSVTVLDGAPTDVAVRLRLGMTPQEVAFPPGLTVRDLLNYARQHYPRSKPVSELAELFGLDPILSRLCVALSGGQKRQLAIAMSFAGSPDLVFLDEPTTGLDVDSRLTIWAGLKRYVTAGGTIVLTTHYLEEVETLAKRATVLHKGRVALEGSVADLKTSSPVKRLRFRSEAELPFAEGTRYSSADGMYVVSTRDVAATQTSLSRFGIDASAVEILPPTLEDAFLALTGKY